ncbi:hypothetical protein ACOSP6_13980 [Tenacibaculum sp. MEBiC06402]|uniref:hypothetical protein n=1 Tax=unclassified Tenacibaculum TaxID=2635139 RepID=UPI003B9CD5CC
MVDSTNTKFSTSVIAITGLITAIGSVITILFNAGIIGKKPVNKNNSKEKTEKKVVIDHSKLPGDLRTKEIDVVPSVKPPKPKVVKAIVKNYNLTGKWIDADSPNARYQINHEDSGAISFTEYSLVFGEWIATASGTGKVTKRGVSIPYKTYLGTNGKFTGKITNNGEKLEGKIQDFDVGMSVTINLQKQ